MDVANRPRFFADSYTMFKRCLTRALRSPEAVIMAIVVPAVIMVLFGFVFGGIVDLGEINYINFIVPGMIVYCIANAAQATSLGLHTDLSTGIVDRFRSMSIAKSAILSGHVWVSVLRSMVITASSLVVSLAIGFRPAAGLFDWLVIAGVLTLFIVMVTWIFVIFGLIAKDAESVSGVGFLFTILVFLSSAFTPTETLPTVLRVFAERQPITLVINALRNLMLGLPAENNALLWAVVWCAGIAAAAFAAAVGIYKRKLTQ